MIVKLSTSLTSVSILFLAAAQSACTVDVGSAATGSASSLVVPPTHELPRSVWESTQAGCEDTLVDGAYEILGAAGEPDLRVVQNNDGAVCVDTIDSVAAELSNVAHGNVLVFLNGREIAFANGIVLTHREFVSGDPSPQPNRPGFTPPSSDEAAGDPSPQPNAPTRPDAADPSPQPNTPPRPNEADPSPQPNGPPTSPSPPSASLLALLASSLDHR